MMSHDLPVSELIQNYPASGIRKMFNIAAQYDDLVNLTLGEPNFDTPNYIKAAAKKAIDEGQTHYTVNVGIPALREAIAERYQKTHWEGYSKDNVIVTVGALEGLTLALFSLVNPGDEVIVPDPCFPNYFGQIMLTGAKAVPVPVYEKNDYRLQAMDVEKAITPKTKGIILNSPSNPLGSVMTREDIEGIAKLALRHGLYVFSDEPYDQIVFDGEIPFSIASVPEIRERVVVLNSFSKSYAMTGWRLGYVVGWDKDLMKHMFKMQQAVASCLPIFTMQAGADAINGPQDCVEDMRRQYERRRDLLYNGLKEIPGMKPFRTEGSFCTFINIKDFGVSSWEFSKELLVNAGVMTIAGTAFGEMGEGYLRICFANSDENILEGVKRIKEYVERRGH